MASEADPLADPLAVQREDRPSCPEHGRMSRLLVPGCSIFCTCDPARWQCPGLDGEGCGHKVMLLPRLVEEFEAHMRSGGAR
jgi:hypothetical protein